MSWLSWLLGHAILAGILYLLWFSHTDGLTTVCLLAALLIVNGQLYGDEKPTS